MIAGARKQRFTALVAGVSILILGQVASSHAEGPFPRLAGSWTGNGRVVLEQGKTEQISCRASYTAKSAGADLALSIRCASNSYKIEMRATLNQQDGHVTGQWEERTFNAAGSVSGRATDTKLNLAISGGVSGTMLVTSSDASQRIEIRTVGSGLSGVTISLARG